MAPTDLLLSRLQDLPKYRQWTKDDVVDLFTALVKQHSVKTVRTDFYTWTAKILYQVEIHKINKSDLLSKTDPGQFVEDVENAIERLAQEKKEKSLEEILDEIRAQGDTEECILREVEDIVRYVTSSTSCAVSTNPPSIKEKLVKLCRTVEDTKKWKPRLTQMVSWCVMVLSSSHQLIQVGTGEGKSCIVAMFAAYRAMIGENVDIISSSSVLAARDAEEWRSFYKKLQITVNCNSGQSEVEVLRQCYACQVVYGTSKDFAGDWLRHRFQRENVRPTRQFQCVIVDEVDSLMLDKGLEVVYLNSEMPVMESLNVILANIWFVVNLFEDPDVETVLAVIRSQLTAADSDLLPSHKNVEIPANKSELKHQEYHIPGFLEHINGRLKVWIENAFHAKTMTLGHEYILHKDGVVPVDYSSTGVVQTDMKWGDGLQQFLEMKEKTRLSNMPIITNFKSNVNLFRSYKQINGLTGTLGNQNELDLLQKLYPGIKTCKIPPFAIRKLYEKDGNATHDQNDWVQTICEVVNRKVNPTVYRGSRAVLVICETIQRAQIVHNALSETIPTEKLKLYTNSTVDNSMVTDKEVKEGWVIVATNLAGRGTDLKVSTEVNVSGGLFVVQTFLPINVRVEQQAFGRTARQGNPGSAQLIMCSTHFSESVKLMMLLHKPLTLLTRLRHLNATIAIAMPEFNVNKFEDTLTNCQKDPTEKNCAAMAKELRVLLNPEKPSGLSNLETEKQSRDWIVQTRLSQILKDDIPKITKKEELFSNYLDMLDTVYEQLSASHREDVVTSLHECWGMWLLMKFDENEPTETLRQQLREDLQYAKNKLYTQQAPSTMIYHYVRTGNTLRKQGSFADSIEMYTRAIKNNSCWPAIALYNRALSVLSYRKAGYITQALADLKEAEEEVDSHISKLTTTLILTNSSKSSNMSSDNPFTKHLNAKRLVQHVFKANIQKTANVLQIAESQGYEVKITKYSILLLVLSPVLLIQGEVSEVGQEIVHLRSLGLDTMFFLETEFSFRKRLMKILSF